MRKILLSLVLVIGANLFAANIKDNEVSLYIPKCDNLIDKKYYLLYDLIN